MRSQRRGWLDVDAALADGRRYLQPTVDVASADLPPKGPWATTAAHGFTRSRAGVFVRDARRSANRTRHQHGGAQRIGPATTDPRRRCGRWRSIRSRQRYLPRRCRPRCRHRRWWPPSRSGPHRARAAPAYAAYRAPVPPLRLNRARFLRSEARWPQAPSGPRRGCRMPCRCTLAVRPETVRVARGRWCARADRRARRRGDARPAARRLAPRWSGGWRHACRLASRGRRCAGKLPARRCCAFRSSVRVPPPCWPGCGHRTGWIERRLHPFRLPDGGACCRFGLMVPAKILFCARRACSARAPEFRR